MSVGYAATYWNVPIFPESCIDTTLDDKTTYATMIRIAGSYRALGLAFIRVFQLYGFHR